MSVALYFPKTTGHCSFCQTLLKQDKIVHLLGTIFSVGLIHSWCKYFWQQNVVCGTESK